MFGYITAIRELPGFFLIFLTALFYRVSQQRLTAFALVALGIGLPEILITPRFLPLARRPRKALGKDGSRLLLQLTDCRVRGATNASARGQYAWCCPHTLSTEFTTTVT